MALAFDTLGYSKRLREAGVPNNQADAHAEAARDFIMTELATKSDVVAVKSDVGALRMELMAAIDAQTLRLTVRLGGMVIAGVGVIAACIGTFGFFLRGH